MRTTVDLDVSILQEAKQLAAQRHTTLSTVVEEALREAAARRRAAQLTEPVQLPTDRRRGGVLPAVDLDNNASLRDLVDTPNAPL